MDFNLMNARIDTLSSEMLARAINHVRDGYSARGMTLNLDINIRQANAVFAFVASTARAGKVQFWVNPYAKHQRIQLWTAIDGDREYQLEWDRDLRNLTSADRVPPRRPGDVARRRVALKVGSGEFNFWEQFARHHF